jgi:hypothetical protein
MVTDSELIGTEDAKDPEKRVEGLHFYLRYFRSNFFRIVPDAKIARASAGGE